MSFNNEVKPSSDADKAADAINYYRQGFLAQAHLLLSQPEFEKEPAAQFALGLCHLSAGEQDAAILCFERALHLIKALPPSAPEPPENNETDLRLKKEHIAEQIYLAPMDEDFCRRFPKSAAQMVLLALIHVYLQKGMTEKAQKLAAGLTGPEFEEQRKIIFEGGSYQQPRPKGTGYVRIINTSS
jgi:tetratricopeptide (TPR) repeat protein